MQKCIVWKIGTDNIEGAYKSYDHNGQQVKNKSFSRYIS